MGCIRVSIHECEVSVEDNDLDIKGHLLREAVGCVEVTIKSLARTTRSGAAGVSAEVYLPHVATLMLRRHANFHLHPATRNISGGFGHARMPSTIGSCENTNTNLVFTLVDSVSRDTATAETKHPGHPYRHHSREPHAYSYFKNTLLWSQTLIPGVIAC
ncbi:hypothetical protein TGME49_228145 [Toxoplasma gondii ME49]|uniref:Uncharacterized protein n=10 Tax=Toxoplasma gondii TaxID=5811 RepID=A0A125YS87_TOXGV|nr:hypothetical protein TGME49_228145 [Toxoplasma gondii ME49]EPR62343.1 hypothetical protein TGGT1_228145 [Toxoplasma gondii GT1]ESS32721.1 hypothetical protein TGVEG_228145 [Toxoplasma gondii VEG]KAF4640822.1 hypothetical protein TGRH88_047480 [Toxoplasma gondii]KFG44976.1 hypothetical protein TGDOM2_228145 [Toxoplasma gondii GAB2-2007-GAL-DOM2]KFG52144.1 hypothetical protein TGFOU_228145 [Toxoplasma gondii FOU]KFH10188.1 hypothetical protein TGMAS_228145 [Toxoplasma gondii MAS]KFH12879.1 |eukprot:XP_018636091.1 hypothetical protein TGME49_228145 [Toxoplasma gondii ME49]